MNRFKKPFILIGMLLPLLSMAQGRYTIKGNLTKQIVSGKVYLIYTTGSKQVKDSAAIKNGLFVISGKLLQPVKARMELSYKDEAGKYKKERREIYLTKERFAINSEETLKDARIENSAINTEWEHYKKVQDESRLALNQVNEEIKKSANSNEEDASILSSRKFMLNTANQLREYILSNYVLQNTDSYFSFLAMDQISGPYAEVEKIEPLFKLLSRRLQKTPEGKALKASITLALTTAIGKEAPGFTRKNSKDEAVSLSQYRGKYVLVDFWASWCGPCRAENPNVILAYNKYQSKNFTVLGLSVDCEVDRAKWLKAVEEDKLPWMQIIDEADGNSTADLYSIKSIPANYLINPEGIIVAKNLRGKQLQEVLAGFLGE